MPAIRQLLCSLFLAATGGGLAVAADVTFHVNFVSELDPIAGSGAQYYADVWAENDYAYVGSNQTNGGVSIFEIGLVD